MRPATPLLAALALALAVLGCGDGDGANLKTAQVSKAAFVEDLEAVCARSYERRKRRFMAFVRGKDDLLSDPQELRRFADTVLLPVRRRQVKELWALGAPSGDEDEVEDILEAYERGIEEMEVDPETIGATVEGDELAELYGVKSCN
jgi:hypothetical protein